ncbi:MAG: DUF4287 domain-containing protein [Robiginitalea sp.]|jgi:hypothetical protein
MDPALKTMIENMPERTGKSLDQWKSLLVSKSFAKHSEAVNFLKKEHGVSHGYANTIVTLSKNENRAPEDLVAAQYSGKEQLLPIYEKLLTVVRAFGADVQVVPKKTTVSLVRKKQFALIKPATKTRIDLGLKLREKEAAGRLGGSGPFGSMCTHRIRLTEAGEVDAELRAWLEAAYAEAG